jgi:CHAD domain-containing protein
MAKAKRIPNLNPEKELNICLPKILKIRFNEMLYYEKGTKEGKDTEFLHSMRIASRRVQAVLKAFHDYYPENKYRKEYEKLRSLIRALGVVRHYDVFIEMLEKYKDILVEKDKDTIEMLLIRQHSLRRQKRKELLITMKELERKKFKNSFQELLSIEK